MRHLLVRQLEGFSQLNDHSLLEIHPIESDNWNYNASVEAGFSIAHDTQNIFLKFIVRESNVRAIYKNTNDPVYEDSCVEFFISFDKGHYYNLEFNCIGTVLGEYGKNRQNRVNLENDHLGSIQVNPSLGTSKILIEDRKTQWTLDVCLPASLFIYSGLDSLKNKTASCNFYKCGDGLKVPHYLSWNPIVSGKPDFHRPDYFGEIKFE
jgi:hypothetical protein